MLIFLCLTLLLATVPLAALHPPSQVCGAWLCGAYENELGSRLNITGTSGWLVSGTYTNYVGSAVGTYPLVGYRASNVVPTTIGWSVTWSLPNGSSTSYSTTSWTGVALTVNGKPTILAQWHLTVPTTYNDYWQSTLSGQDTFFGL
jgi:hypothetical protein